MDIWAPTLHLGPATTCNSNIASSVCEKEDNTLDNISGKDQTTRALDFLSSAKRRAQCRDREIAVQARGQWSVRFSASMFFGGKFSVETFREQ